MNRPETEKLPTVVTVGKRGTILSAWCPWCETCHEHGHAVGNRVAHCNNQLSPLGGYHLVACRPADFPKPLRLTGGAKLSDFMLPVPGVRALCSALVPGLNWRTRSQVTRSLKDAHVKISSDFRWVLTFGPGPNWIEGNCLLTLGAKIFAVTSGIVALRILEAVTGAKFDAEARLGIAGVIDAWAIRTTSAHGGL